MSSLLLSLLAQKLPYVYRHSRDSNLAKNWLQLHNHTNVIHVTERTAQALLTGIAGSGRRPETWATVVLCLRQVGLNFLAETVEGEYSESARGAAGRGDTPGDKLSIVIT